MHYCTCAFKLGKSWIGPSSFRAHKYENDSFSCTFAHCKFIASNAKHLAIRWPCSFFFLSNMKIRSKIKLKHLKKIYDLNVTHPQTSCHPIHSFLRFFRVCVAGIFDMCNKFTALHRAMNKTMKMTENRVSIACVSSVVNSERQVKNGNMEIILSEIFLFMVFKNCSSLRCAHVSVAHNNAYYHHFIKYANNCIEAHACSGT